MAARLAVAGAAALALGAGVAVVADSPAGGPDYAAPGVPWSAIDPTGKGRLDPAARARMVKAAAQVEAFRVWLGVSQLRISPHGGYQPHPSPPGWPDRNPTSQHKLGSATDLYPPEGWGLAKFHAKAQEFMAKRGGGLGFYTWGCHLDTRPSSKLVTWGSPKPEAFA